jgi:hypothetical protein
MPGRQKRKCVVAENGGDGCLSGISWWVPTSFFSPVSKACTAGGVPWALMRGPEPALHHRGELPALKQVGT